MVKLLIYKNIFHFDFLALVIIGNIWIEKSFFKKKKRFDIDNNSNQLQICNALEWWFRLFRSRARRGVSSVRRGLVGRFHIFRWLIKHFKTIITTLNHPFFHWERNVSIFGSVTRQRLSSTQYWPVATTTTCRMCGSAPIYFDSDLVRATTSRQPEINWSDTATKLQDPPSGEEARPEQSQSKWCLVYFCIQTWNGKFWIDSLYKKCGYFYYSLAMRVSRPHSGLFFCVGGRNWNSGATDKSRTSFKVVWLSSAARSGSPQMTKKTHVERNNWPILISSSFFFLFISRRKFVLEIPFPRENFYFVSFLCSSATGKNSEF